MKYTIGLDYGTLSVRALLVETATGKEVATAVYEYPHGVMSETLPTGEVLPPLFALQHPQDYIDGMEQTIKSVMKASGVDKNSVIGIGVDFTSCTTLPIKEDGTPLCLTDEFAREPHAFVKMWKHHSPVEETERINKAMEEYAPEFVETYGGKISCEFFLPKLLETIEKAPKVYESADLILEAGDYITYILTGNLVRSACNAGFKAFYDTEKGYVNNEFLKAVHPKFATVTQDKMRGKVMLTGNKAGNLTKEWAERLGLSTDTAVAVSTIDAHTALPSAGFNEEGKMLMIMGTSTCHITITSERKSIEGISGEVKDGIIEGFYCTEGGQASVGDCFSWVVDELTPAKYEKIAKEKGMNIHEYLTSLIENNPPKADGVVALDWLNGVRTPVDRADLNATIDGLTLRTKVEDIYRAFIEGTAFGTKTIVDLFEGEVNEIYACGGIAKKNPFVMQVYADVLQKPIKVVRSNQAVALGSAIFGATAAGKSKGGYDSIYEAIENMKSEIETEYIPNPDYAEIYEKLFLRYTSISVAKQTGIMDAKECDYDGYDCGTDFNNL